MKGLILAVSSLMFLFGWGVAWALLDSLATIHLYEVVAIAFAFPVGFLLFAYANSLPFFRLPPKNRIYLLRSVGKINDKSYLLVMVPYQYQEVGIPRLYVLSPRKIEATSLDAGDTVMNIKGKLRKILIDFSGNVG